MSHAADAARSTSTSRLAQIAELGQAIWIDDLNRHLLDDGGLRRLVEQDGVSGVTSNPTIFAKAIADSDRYDDALRELARDDARIEPRDAFLKLAHQDVRDAADTLRDVYERTEGQDGYVSFELPPEMAFDAERSDAEARSAREAIDRANVLIKVPGTEQGLRAFERLTEDGHSINVTLLFAVSRYEQFAEAYVRALERRAQRGEPIDRIASVASFFVSRVDSAVDAELDERGRPELKGRAGVANAKIAYETFQRIFGGPRWEALRRLGANVQRPLWASTSTKNPDYRDTLYVDELIGPDTVNTMPDETLAAARDHARVELAVTRDVEAAHAHMGALAHAGVDVERIVLQQLVQEGLDKFVASFDEAVAAVARELDALARG